MFPRYLSGSLSSYPYMKKYGYWFKVYNLSRFYKYRCGQSTSSNTTFYGTSMKNATMNFQAFFGVYPVDGEAGPVTIRAAMTIEDNMLRNDR